MILPEENRKDLEDIPEDVRNQVTFHFVSTIDQVLALMFSAPEKKKAVRKKSEAPSGKTVRKTPVKRAVPEKKSSSAQKKTVAAGKSKTAAGKKSVKK